MFISKKAILHYFHQLFLQKLLIQSFLLELHLKCYSSLLLLLPLVVLTNNHRITHVTESDEKIDMNG